MDWLLPVRPADDDPLAFEVSPHSDRLGTYGSFLMACAVRAASATVEGMALTALHADFLTPPAAGAIRFDVEATRSGRSVAVRRVVVGQAGPCVVMTLSFAAPAPTAPSWAPEPAPFDEAPESLDRCEENAAGIALLDVRPVQPVAGGGAGYERRHPFWARPAQPFGEGLTAAAAAIAMATDHFVTAMATPTDEGPAGLAVTLDHSLWLHRRSNADEWLRYDADLIAVVDGRAVIRGTVSDTAGRLVGTFVQQALRRDGGSRRS